MDVGVSGYVIASEPMTNLTATPLSYGRCDTRLASSVNLADQRLENLCRGDSPKWIPAVQSVNDGAVINENVGRYQPNAWGLYDLHGTVCEWTLSTYKPYPYASDGRDHPRPEGQEVVRGGSFYDPPERACSSYRLSYPSCQCVFNLGFRVVMLDEPPVSQLSAA
jgi:hypothetical protein